MLKKALTLIAVSLFGICLSLAFIELGFRLFRPKAPEGWNDRPQQYFIHEASETFQDYPHDPQKSANTYRIAVIGDSFTFAPYMQFDDAFPKRMERFLNLNTGAKKVEVINYGVPAYSTNHEVPVVKKAIAEGADVILMQITLNDPEIKPYTPEQLYREKNKFGELELTNPIFSYWSSLAFVLKRLHNNETHRNYKKKFFDLFEKPKTWANFSNSWKTIASIGKEKKVPVVSVVFPLFGIPVGKDYPFYPIHEKVGTFLQSIEVPSLDLSTIYNNIPLERLQVIVGQDFHPNEIAHRMAAEAILRWWKEKQIIPNDFFPRVSSNERIGIRKPGGNSAQGEIKSSQGDSSLNDEGETFEQTED